MKFEYVETYDTLTGVRDNHMVGEWETPEAFMEYVKNHNGLYIFGRTSTHIDAKDPRYSKWNWHKNGKIGGR